MSVWCVVVAAGRGVRAGLGMNKVYAKLEGRSVLSRCLDALAASEVFDGIVLVISAEDEALYRELCESEGAQPLVKHVVHGGDCRRRSVRNGLALVPEDAEIVAVHDAARPFVSPEVVRATVESARDWGSGVISTPVTDTIKRAKDGVIQETPDRDELFAVQTPQVFDADLIRTAETKAM